MLVQVILTSCIGQVRQNHEDNYLLPDGRHLAEQTQRKLAPSQLLSDTEHAAHRQRRSLCAVSDGMGGYNAGEVASRMAVTALNACRPEVLASKTLDLAIERIQQYIDQINREITNAAGRNAAWHNMGATLSVLLMYEDSAVAINVGDSPVFRYDGQHLVQISTMHTESRRMVEMGLLSEHEAQNLPRGKALTRYLGASPSLVTMQGSAGEICAIQENTWFLLCTDGLTDMVLVEEIQAILCEYHAKRQPEPAVSALVDAALRDRPGKRGGSDNITVMLVAVSEDTGWWKRIQWPWAKR